MHKYLDIHRLLSVYLFKMDTVATIDETRQHARDPVEHEIHLILKRELPHGGERVFPARIVDKSDIGFCVETSYYVSSGDLLKICTDLSSDSEMYFHVRWVDNLKSSYLFGCNFVDLSLPSHGLV